MTEQILGPGSETDQLIRRLKKQNKNMKGKWIGEDIDRVEQEIKSEDKEWSLKKKENFIPDAGAHSVDFFDENCYYYNKKDIDALREKLIEDIKTYRDFSGPNYTNMIDMIEIVNRRFGYDMS